MKTSELIGPALDWAVAKCEGHEAHVWGGTVRTNMREVFGPECNYSTNWAQGGPIIERESIELRRYDKHTWMAEVSQPGHAGKGVYAGPTPLIAVMRCFVSSRLGDEIEIPEELK